MENITTIIFDLGGVLINIDFKKLFKAFQSIGINNFEGMYSQSTATPLFKDLEKGKLSETEFYEKMKDCTELEVTTEQIKNAWNSLLLNFRKESLQKVTSLKNKYRTILLSNTNSIHLSEVNKIFEKEIGKGSLEMYFDKMYYSHLIGLRKPDKEVFNYVLQENNVKATETLLIDDSVQNIEGARLAGMKAIFLEKGMTIDELKL